ncbi:hypothetical protein SLS56_002426 [Neofusicoccum ribis]|uniref:Major facilitator superfamily (MFS) profile domain-containing protein n=1 Tax=Neofusicoccum ribis TaxID=45134 RepID=A0ABR3T3P4_9PEZI
MLGQSVGPVFGGILTRFLGFRSIFWSLTILGAIALFLILFFLPETLRSIAGNGTTRLTGIHKPFLYHLKPQPHVSSEPDPPQPRKRLTARAFFDPVRFLFEKDVFITLLFGGIVYTVWSMITSSTPSLFQSLYHIDDLLLGLAFLPNGAGCVLGSYGAGLLMDFDYKRTVAEHRRAHAALPDAEPSSSSSSPAPESFSIERARLRSAPWFAAAFALAVAAYGFALGGGGIDRALVLQFAASASAAALFAVNAALAIDLWPRAGASAAAAGNLVRCSFGAAGVAVVEPLVRALSPRWAFVVLAGVAAAAGGLLWVEMRWGVGWRREREGRVAGREARGV